MFPLEQTPYEGAKAMLLVDIENPSEIASVIADMIPEVKNPKKRR